MNKNKSNVYKHRNVILYQYKSNVYKYGRE